MIQLMSKLYINNEHVFLLFHLELNCLIKCTMKNDIFLDVVTKI